MKKLISLSLILALMLSLTIMAHAESSAFDAGFYDIEAASGITITPISEDNKTVSSSSVHVDKDWNSLYPGSVKFDVQYTKATKGCKYAIFLVEGDSLPKADTGSLKYIDQVTATGSTVSFTVYPMLPTKQTSLTLFITSDDEVTTSTSTLSTVKYALAGNYETAPYTLGDVNEDGNINSVDALMILQIAAGLKTNATDSQKMAADVSKDGSINSVDALKVLQHAAGLINSWN